MRIKRFNESKTDYILRIESEDLKQAVNHFLASIKDYCRVVRREIVHIDENFQARVADSHKYSNNLNLPDVGYYIELYVEALDEIVKHQDGDIPKEQINDFMKGLDDLNYVKETLDSLLMEIKDYKYSFYINNGQLSITILDPKGKIVHLNK